MIRSFRDAEARKIFERLPSRRLPASLRKKVLRKLLMLDAADKLDDLRVPPGNRLERLSGDRSDQHSVRVNDQWRICFEWHEGGADQVELVDYH